MSWEAKLVERYVSCVTFRAFALPVFRFVRYVSNVTFRALRCDRYVSSVKFPALRFQRYVSCVTFRVLRFQRYVSLSDTFRALRFEISAAICFSWRLVYLTNFSSSNPMSYSWRPISSPAKHHLHLKKINFSNLAFSVLKQALYQLMTVTTPNFQSL